MSDKNFRTAVVGFLAIQLFMLGAIFHKLNSNVRVYVSNPVYEVKVRNDKTCGTNDNPCVVTSSKVSRIGSPWVQF